MVINAYASFANAGTLIGGQGGFGYFPAGSGGAGAGIYGGTLSNVGTIQGGAGGYPGDAARYAGAGVLIDGGFLNNAGLIEAGAYSAHAQGHAIAFGANGGFVNLFAGSSLLGAIAGWHQGDYVSLENIAATSEIFSPGTGGHAGTLTLYAATGQAVDTLHFTGALTTGSFTLFQLTSGGTEIAFGS